MSARARTVVGGAEAGDRVWTARDEVSDQSAAQPRPIRSSLGHQLATFVTEQSSARMDAEQCESGGDVHIALSAQQVGVPARATDGRAWLRLAALDHRA